MTAIIRVSKFRLLIFVPFLSLSLFIPSIYRGSTRFLSSPKNLVTSNSIIIYKAYLEKSHTNIKNQRIRILAFSKCHLASKNALVHVKAHDGKSYKAKITPIEGECPWHWAPNCTWNSFILDANVPSMTSSDDKITVTYKHHEISLPVETKKPALYDLAVCVPPLYWYTEWVRFIEFIEIWKILGTSHFYVYYQSLSKLLFSILKEYEKNGIITLIPWTELPSSEKEDPNESLYRLGHSLAHNDCLLRARGRFLALVDIDEVILPNNHNQTLLQFLNASLKSHPLAGSFLFNHAKLGFPASKLKPNSDLYHLDFKWLLSATAYSGNGPSKVVFMPDRVDVTLTHRVRRHQEPYSEVEISENDALLYHARSTWKFLNSSDPEGNSTILPIQDFFTNDLRLKVMQNYRTIVQKIHDSTLLKKSLYSKAPHLLRQCLDDWKNKLGCKTPFRSCRENLSIVEEWVFSSVDKGRSGQFYVL